MAVFNKPEDYASLTEYPKKLHKALETIEQDKPVPFVYLNIFQFDTAQHRPMTRPLVMVAHASALATGLPTGQKWTAKGTARLTSEGKIKFDVDTGKLLTIALQRFFKEMGHSLPEIEINPEELNGPGHAAPPLPTPAAQAAAPAAPSAPLTLPVNAGSQASFIEQYANALTAAKLPVDEGWKQRAIKAVYGFLKNEKYADALVLLNGLVKDVTYPGVASWVLDPASRRHGIEALTENYTAMLSLLQSKCKGQSDDEVKDQADIAKALGDVIRAGTEMNGGFMQANPGSVKQYYDKWVILEKEKTTYAERIKRYWHPDQTRRLIKELSALPERGKGSNLYGMIEQYGKDETMELAQMAEVQAITYQNKPENKTDVDAQARHDTKLNIAELASIFSYSTANYNVVNKLLRNDPKNQEDRDEIEDAKKKFTAYIESAKSGLMKLPIYTGMVYRSNKSFWADFINQITTSGTFTEPSFMSSAKEKTSGFGDLDLRIEPNKTGRDISMFSLHPTEGEILFPPGAVFRFLAAEVVGPDGSKVKFKDPAAFATHVTTQTRVGRFFFSQTG